MPDFTEQQVAEVAGKLSDAQQAYIAAVGKADGPYKPRHGRTANWAVRHGYTQTIVRLGDRVGGWDDFSWEERFDPGIDGILGQTLTPFGLAVRVYLERQQ